MAFIIYISAAELTFAAEKPPLAHAFEQAAPPAAEENGGTNSGAWKAGSGLTAFGPISGQSAQSSVCPGLDLRIPSS
jgi:hypothetical protein